MTAGRSRVAIALALGGVATAGCADVLGLDPTDRRDAGGGDSGTPDAGAFDSCLGCNPTPIARWRFEDDLTDDTGMHPAAPVGSDLTYVPDADGTGRALHIPTALTAYARVEDSSAFDLAAGRITLRFNVGPSAPARDLGLLSRDANSTTVDGHINLRVTHDRKVLVRIQRMSDPQVSAFRCTDAAVAPGWHDVEATFGPAGLTLAVDGAPATGETYTNAEGTTHSCTAPWTLGIAGNDNPWIIGGLTTTAVEGTGAPVTDIAGDVDLDEIAIWALP